ncbi:Chemotaxis protein CheY [uncultured archaeon]|nr:Chemotaxis protein CheY [uncultured archaeon]
MGKMTVLVVEDEKIVAMDIENRLKKYGYFSSSASSGEEAMEKIEEIHPDLVLMDIMLKGKMDGVEAAGIIRKSFSIPVVYLTAYADETTLQRAKITQPFGYIIKPFEERELRVAVEMALCKYKMEKKLRDSEQWLTATLKSIGDAVIATDEKGLVKFMNPYAEALTGQRQEDAAGKPLKNVFNIVSEETGKQVEDPITKVIREGIFFGLADKNLLVARGGTRIPVDITGTRILDDRNNILGIVLVFYDIIERKKLEKSICMNQKC